MASSAEPAERSESDGEVRPLLGARPVVEELGDAADDGAELVVVESPDEDAAGMVAAGFCPLPQQRSEVAGVSGHQDAGLLGSDLEHLGVIKRAECRVGREAEDVVASGGERTADALG